MISNIDCIMCLMDRQAKEAKSLSDPVSRTEYLTRSMRIIADNAGSVPAPVIVDRLRPLRAQYLGDGDDYLDRKVKYNDLMLRCEADIAADISSADDRLYRALLYARTGNYIDFGAMSEVDEGKLMELLHQSPTGELDRDVYDALRADLGCAENLVYLLDNCGELVLDKSAIAELRREYPDLGITAITRGGYVLNDATEEDAFAVGIDKYAEVIGNGNRVPGTWMPQISDRAREAILSADVIISKGQANFETICGSGLNIYYLLLCKCLRFTEIFGKARYSGLFLRERDLDIARIKSM